jgi:hypothetical protein
MVRKSTRSNSAILARCFPIVATIPSPESPPEASLRLSSALNGLRSAQRGSRAAKPARLRASLVRARALPSNRRQLTGGTLSPIAAALIREHMGRNSRHDPAVGVVVRPQILRNSLTFAGRTATKPEITTRNPPNSGL